MGVFGTDSFLARPRRKMFLVVFVIREMVMVTCSGSVLSSLPPSSSMSGIFPKSLTISANSITEMRGAGFYCFRINLNGNDCNFMRFYFSH